MGNCPIYLLLFTCVLLSSVYADAGWNVVSQSSGGATILVQEQTNQWSTDLFRFNTTDGQYRDLASRTSAISNGLSGHTFSNVNNGNQNGTLAFQAASAALTSDVIAMHEDNTNVPTTLCDANGVPIPPASILNATNNTSTVIPGIVAMSQEAVTAVTFMGQGTVDDALTYNSNRNLEGTNISLDYEASSPIGNLYRSSYDYIAAGNNRKNEVMQYHQDDRGHLTKASNETEGLSVREKLAYTGYSYDGPDKPTSWKTVNTTNSTIVNTSALANITVGEVSL